MLIALQLGITHWFYLYIPWFFPLVLVALICAHPERLGVARPELRADFGGLVPVVGSEAPNYARSE